MIIPRGTTPSIPFTFKTIDTATIVVAYLTIEQAGVQILEKDLSEAVATEGKLEWTLTQEETLAIRDNIEMRIQCRYRTNDGSALASRIYDVYPYEILKEGVI